MKAIFASMLLYLIKVLQRLNIQLREKNLMGKIEAFKYPKIVREEFEDRWVYPNLMS